MHISIYVVCKYVFINIFYMIFFKAPQRTLKLISSNVKIPGNRLEWETLAGSDKVGGVGTNRGNAGV